MKIKILGSTIVVIIALAIAFNINLNAGGDQLSLLNLSNIQALADPEGNNEKCDKYERMPCSVKISSNAMLIGLKDKNLVGGYAREGDTVDLKDLTQLWPRNNKGKYVCGKDITCNDAVKQFL